MILPGSWRVAGLRHIDSTSDNAVVRPVFSAVRIRVIVPDCDTSVLSVVSTGVLGSGKYVVVDVGQERALRGRPVMGHDLAATGSGRLENQAAEARPDRRPHHNRVDKPRPVHPKGAKRFMSHTA